MKTRHIFLVILLLILTLGYSTVEAQPSVSVYLSPHSTIVQTGENLLFDVTLTNNTIQPQTFYGVIDVWDSTRAELTYGSPIYGPMALEAEESVTYYDVSLPIPDSPEYIGNHFLEITIGTSFSDIWDKGSYDFSVTDSLILPNAPGDLIATAISSSRIDLNWQDNSNNEDGFQILRYDSVSGWYWIDVVANTEYYSDTGLSPATAYQYTVLAYNSTGTSGWSNAVFATTLSVATVPNAPGNLVAGSTSSTQITLSWQDNSDNEEGFKVERALYAGGPWSQIDVTGVNVSSYSDIGLSPSTTYYYRVRAYNSAGNSGYTSITSTTTQDTSNVWSWGFGDAETDFGYSVAVDSSGNVFVTGTFYGTVDFGGGAFTSVAHPYLGTTPDIFLAKYSVTGEHLWSKSFGGDSNEAAKAVAVDASGNVAIAGDRRSWEIDFGCGTDRGEAKGDIFVAKYSALGDCLWSKTFGGSGNEYATDVAMDSNGDVIVTGYFWDTVDFGGGELTSAGRYNYDVFVAKYSAADGSHLWSKRFGSTGSERGNGVAVDRSGNVLVTGQFQDTVDFGGGGLTSAGDYDVFVAKYSAAGYYQWSRRFGGTNWDYSTGIATDSLGNLFVVGEFQGTASFGGGVLSSAGDYDIFVARYSGVNGDHLWSKGFGSTNPDYVEGVAVDGIGNVFVTGSFLGEVDFGGGAFTSVGYDIFVVKYSASGEHLWSEQYWGPWTQYAKAIAVSGNSRVAITGDFENSVDFGDGQHTSNGGSDIFLLSIEP